jgi:hypothetical protein
MFIYFTLFLSIFKLVCSVLFSNEDCGNIQMPVAIRPFTNVFTTAVWTHLRMFLNSKFYHFMFKCWILLKPVLGGVDGTLHFPVPSMNRLNQTEPATFSILSCWAFLRDSVFIYFTNVTCPCPCALSCFCLGVLLGSLPLALVTGSGGGCVHWTPPFLVDLVYHIFCIIVSGRHIWWSISCIRNDVLIRCLQL